jgi:hypothetical protein
VTGIPCSCHHAARQQDYWFDFAVIRRILQFLTWHAL